MQDVKLAEMKRRNIWKLKFIKLKPTVTSKVSDLKRGIDDFNKGYQPTTNIVKAKKGYLITDSYSILARWRNHFFQLLNVHGVNSLRQTAIHVAEPLVPDPNVGEVQLAIEKQKVTIHQALIKSQQNYWRRGLNNSQLDPETYYFYLE